MRGDFEDLEHVRAEVARVRHYFITTTIENPMINSFEAKQIQKDPKVNGNEDEIPFTLSLSDLTIMDSPSNWISISAT